MPVLELTDEQVVSLVKQLPPERRREALQALAASAGARRTEPMNFAEEQLRRICRDRGQNWDAMSETEREVLIDGLFAEDRPCGQYWHLTLT